MIFAAERPAYETRPAEMTPLSRHALYRHFANSYARVCRDDAAI